MTIAPLAQHFTALLAAGQVDAAARTYWAENVVTIEPEENDHGSAATATGYIEAHEKLRQWLAVCELQDIVIDGPFVTGNIFALFVDMVLTSRTTGERRPFSEIAVYTVADGKITEERYFYDRAFVSKDF